MFTFESNSNINLQKDKKSSLNFYYDCFKVTLGNFKETLHIMVDDITGQTSVHISIMNVPHMMSRAVLAVEPPLSFLCKLTGMEINHRNLWTIITTVLQITTVFLLQSEQWKITITVIKDIKINTHEDKEMHKTLINHDY